MMKKFLSTPMTWGSYLKFSGIVSAIALLGEGIWFIVFFWDYIKSWLGRKIDKILPKKEE